MSEHPGDTAPNRFRAGLAGLLAFVSFGAVLWLALQAAGPQTAVEPGVAERAAERRKNLADVRAAQEAAVAPGAIEKALPAALENLKAKKAQPTTLVVPGSPTSLKATPPAATPPAATADGKTPAAASTPSPAPAAPPAK